MITASVMYRGGANNGNYAGTFSSPLSCIAFSADIYKGGNNSGLYSGYFYTAMACPQLAGSDIHRGGSGNGFSWGEDTAITACVSTSLASTIFYGGNGNGFAWGEDTATTACVSTSLASNIFYGGNGNGFAWGEDTATTACVSTSLASNIFYGGNGNGFAWGEDTAITACSFVATIGAFYLGGPNNGFGWGEDTAITPCSSPHITSSIYSGGSNSGGYSGFQYSNLLCAPLATAPYAGDAEDGYHRVTISASTMYKGGQNNGNYAGTFNTPAICSNFGSSIYAGGADNGGYWGYDYNTTLSCNGPVASLIYYGGDYNGFAWAEDTATTYCTPTPSSAAYYFGGDYNGFAWAEDTALTACATSPSVAAYYYGGFEDGFGFGEDTALTACSPAPAIAAYYFGGFEDGFGFGEDTALTACSALPYSAAYYYGGFEDGFGFGQQPGNTSNPSVSITASADSICSGESVSFTALPVSGGGSPVYQWYLNGNPVGANTATYVNSALADGDAVYVTMVSGLYCSPQAPVFSNTAVTSVISALSNNSISSSQNVCVGTQVSNLTGSLPSGGNGSYIYLWQSSPDNISWNTAPGTSNAQNYDPSSLPGDAYLRRLVYAGCAQASVSDTAFINFQSMPTQLTPTTGVSGSCNILSEDNWVYISDLSDRLIVAVKDSSGGNDLQQTTATITIDPTVQNYFGMIYMQRHVDIVPGSNGPARVRLYFTQTELDSLMTKDPSITSHLDLGVTKFTGPGFSGGIFVLPDSIYQNTPFTDVYTVELNISGFSSFFIHKNNISNPLPINLLSFNADCNEGKVAVRWVTATETNNDFFTLERSNDASDWEAVGIVDGAGNSNQARQYGFTDHSPMAGISYYRLRQTDFDGNYSWYQPAAVECDAPEGETMEVFPNPVYDGQMQLSIFVNSDSRGVLSLTNVLGQEVLKKSIPLRRGGNKLSLSLNTVGNGLYHLKLQTSSGLILSREVMILK